MTCKIINSDIDRLVATRAKLGCGFVSHEDVAAMTAHPAHRLVPLLVRCGGTRFVAPAQNVDTMIAAIERAGDYVRDVSFPAV
jgi:hypothetical protein